MRLLLSIVLLGCLLGSLSAVQKRGNLTLSFKNITKIISICFIRPEQLHEEPKASGLLPGHLVGVPQDRPLCD